MSDPCDSPDDPAADLLDRTLRSGWTTGTLGKPALPRVTRADLALVEKQIRAHHDRAREHREYALRLRLHAHDLRAAVSQIMATPLGEPVGTSGTTDAVAARLALIEAGLLARRFLPDGQVGMAPGEEAPGPGGESPPQATDPMKIVAELFEDESQGGGET